MKPLCIDNDPLEVVGEWKYLGTTISDGNSFSFSARPDISNFFRAANAILNVLSGAHEHTLLYLLHSNCLPIITYACNVKQFSAGDMSDCNVAVNSAFRKIFGFRDWRSIRDLREVFGFESIYITFKKAQDKFLQECKRHPNPTIRYPSRLICRSRLVYVLLSHFYC